MVTQFFDTGVVFYCGVVFWIDAVLCADGTCYSVGADSRVARFFVLVRMERSSTPD